MTTELVAWVERLRRQRCTGAEIAALNRGFTAPIVMTLGGWKTEKMMRRYAAVMDQTLRAAAEAVSGAASAPDAARVIRY